MYTWSTVLLVSATWSAGQAAAAGSGADIIQRAPSEAVQPVAGLPELVSGLTSANWQVREASTRSLIELGPSIYSELEAAFRSSRSAEQRRRIRHIVREIHYNSTVGPVLAFLGVQPEHVNGDSYPPRVFPGSTGVHLRMVIAGSSAYRAGLVDGDVIVSINGSSAAGHDTAQAFTEWIGSQRPGSRCRLTVVRGCEGVRFGGHANSRFNPRWFRNVQTRSVTRNDHSIIPEGAVALEVTDASRAPAELGIRPGDLIISLDGAPLPVADAPQALRHWAENAQVPDPQADQRRVQLVFPGVRQQPGGQPRDGESYAVVLRGGRLVDIEVELGERPAYLRDGKHGGGRAGQRGVDPRTLAEADAAFEQLWAARFADSDPSPDDEPDFELP